MIAIRTVGRRSVSHNPRMTSATVVGISNRVRAQEIGEAKEHDHNRIELDVEVPQHAGKLRQHEHQEEDQHAPGGK